MTTKSGATASAKKSTMAKAKSGAAGTARMHHTKDGTSSKNPFFNAWSTPFEAPPFAAIATEHFTPAFERSIAGTKAEIAAIASDAAPPTFDNTVAALERVGQSLSKVASVFFNLTGAHTNPALQSIERSISPVLAKFHSETYTNAALFARVHDLYERRVKLRLSPEKRRVLELTHRGFVRSGAQLDAAGKTRMAQIVERLASLGTQFSQNVLADESAYTLVLETPEDVTGLPDFLLSASAAVAKDRDLDGQHVITLSRSLIEPFLKFSARRDLREKAYQAWSRRGEMGGATDNCAIVKETVALRLEMAQLLGFKTFAHFKLDGTMANTPEAARDLLDKVWPAARARAERERGLLQEMARSEGGNFTIAPWDWRYYAEKVRKAQFDLDEADIKPYLSLDRMLEAAFYTAKKLFGLSFVERHDVPVYHPDVRVWEVQARGGRHVGLFLGDYFARPSKRSGAWMSSFRRQQKLIGNIRPIIVNVLNCAKAADGQPTLLSYDDARTLFHEFGHALHGLLSNVTYPSISGTATPTDFVEFPSQLYEHWLERPEVLQKFARHYQSDAPMPEALIKKLLAARTFNQGFMTVEYTASALVDMEFHALDQAADIDPVAFEAKVLARIGMPKEISMRHRTPHFLHVFAGGGYAAGYYSYLWSEVLDADGFRAFTEQGDVFDPETAKRLKKYVYAAGGLREPKDAYIAFRGRLPSIEALKEQRGLG